MFVKALLPKGSPPVWAPSALAGVDGKHCFHGLPLLEQDLVHPIDFSCLNRPNESAHLAVTIGPTEGTKAACGMETSLRGTGCSLPSLLGTQLESRGRPGTALFYCCVDPPGSLPCQPLFVFPCVDPPASSRRSTGQPGGGVGLQRLLVRCPPAVTSEEAPSFQSSTPRDPGSSSGELMSLLRSVSHWRVVSAARCTVSRALLLIPSSARSGGCFYFFVKWVSGVFWWRVGL